MLPAAAALREGGHLDNFTRYRSMKEEEKRRSHLEEEEEEEEEETFI